MSARGGVLRVLTWNVHGCVGRDGVCDPGRIASVLAEVDPDISALQEIDARRDIPDVDDVFGFFSERLGWTTLKAKTLADERGHYGHVLMSRWPVYPLGVEDISVRGREPRQALVASIDGPEGPIGVVAAHLGLLPGERRRQLARLRRILSGLGCGPVIALGDFNDVRARGVSERRLCPPLERAPAVPTFPAALPLLPLDRIWCSRPLEILRVRALRHVQDLSDHLPLLAEVAARPWAIRS